MVVPAHEPESGAGAWICARAGREIREEGVLKAIFM